MKQILNRTIVALNARKNGYCRISHKRGWLDYLVEGDPCFSPRRLHEALRSVIEGAIPRGAKLFFLRRANAFTLTAAKRPYRPEEALERFIVMSNDGDFFNQIPIGGGKESIDIGIKESASRFTFVELKPWESQNSPLYALVESFKNLMEYRIILERGLADIPRFDEVSLLVLAPIRYYERHDLTSDRNRAILNETLRAACDEFQTRISFEALDIEKDAFLDCCERIYEERQLVGQVILGISEADAIPSLKRENWRLIAR